MAPGFLDEISVNGFLTRGHRRGRAGVGEGWRGRAVRRAGSRPALENPFDTIPTTASRASMPERSRY
jgi:hypothetical protein